MAHSKKAKKVDKIKEQEKFLKELVENDYDSSRQRQDKEDELLNIRTGSFLTANTILFAVSQLQKDNGLFSKYGMGLNCGIAIVGILVSIFWILVSYRTSLYIYFFSSIRQKILPNHYSNFISEYKRPKLLLTPTSIIALWLPLFILFSWFAFFTFILFINKLTLYFIILTIVAIVLVTFFIIRYWRNMKELRNFIKGIIIEQNKNITKPINK
jgi:hypothetical protein